jgi:hypothetical protein
MTTRRTTRALAGLAVLAAFLVAACTPEQIAAVQQAVVQQQAADKFHGAVSADGLARLRACESGGNYGAVSRTGTYRGAYQFSRTTWNSVARSHYPHLQGVDPAVAAPHDQDRMARALWATAGRGQWPHCGKRV